MHASTLLATLLALGLGSAEVIMRNEANAAAAAASAAPAAASGAPAPAAAPAPNAAAADPGNPQCAQAMILAQGIALNINDQQQELATANEMAQLLATQPVNSQAFGAARTNLLQFINNGIAIRQMNQLITPAGNRATAGIATVANAQLEELNLATGLTPQGSPQDAQIVATLQKDFTGGIQQNMKNMADAMAGCGAAAQPGAPQPAQPATAVPQR